MPCRHAAGDRSERGIDGENFRRTALAVGGERALASLLDREGPPDLADGDPVPDRQHDWTATDGCPVDHSGGGHSGSGHSGHSHDGGSDDSGAESRDGSDEGCPVDHAGSESDGDRDASAPSPQYHLLARLAYEGSTPTDEDRRAVETALSDLASELGWGPGRLVFALGYSRRYFDRFEADLPAGVAAALGASDPPVATDGGTGSAPDALLHLASDDPRILLAAELALWGADPALDVSLSGTFEGVFARPVDPPERRVAVAGRGWSSPDGDVSVGARDDGFAGAAIERLVRPPDRRGDGGGSTGCPVDHGDSGDDGDAREGPGRSADGGDPGESPGRSADEGEPPGGRLRGLEPGDPGTVAVTFPDGRAPGDDARPVESYVVPPVSGWALPRPEGSVGR